MKIVNDKLLDFARGPGTCEWCRKYKYDRDPHHIVSRGAGGPDIRCNIAALCRACHSLVHSGEIDDNDILAMVAMREDALQGDIEDLVNCIRWRMPRFREMSVERYERVVSQLNFGARRLAMRELEEFRHLWDKQ